MALPSWTEELDTQLSIALDVYTGSPAQMINEGGEKLLNEAKRRGRIFGVKDSERVRHPVTFGGHGVASHGDTGYYKADQMDGSVTGGGLGSTAEDIMTWAQFSQWAATRNINMPQSMPAGDLFSYAKQLVKNNLVSIFGEEEDLFWLGYGGTTTVPVATCPFEYDTNYATVPTGYSGGPTPMSALSLFWEGSNTTKYGSGETFAGIDASTLTTSDQWTPQRRDASSGSGGNAAELIQDLQDLVLDCGFTEKERITNFYTARGVYNTVVNEMRKLGALPDPVRANLATESAIPVAGATLDWHRKLVASDEYDSSVAFGAAGTAYYPIYGFNMNSLRLNMVMSHSPLSGDPSFVRQVTGVLPHPTTANLFKRIAWKRCWSVDGGRRSFGVLEGYNSSGTNML